jgi:esterase/lipase superfamily enzyme
VFVGTTRAPDPRGGHGFERSERLGLVELDVSIPPEHAPGQLEFSYADPDPQTEFTLAARRSYDDPAGFRARIRAELAQLPPAEREISVFVHGYNATQAETAFRAAQLFHDLRVPGVSVIYSWPSRGKVGGYIYDHDSALFARDGLEELLRLLEEAGAARIILLAHSMGSVVTIETLRQMDLATPGWPARMLGGVVLISPDINVDVFRRVAHRIDPLPQPFVIMASSKDAALNLSALISGSTDRLGTLDDLSRVDDLPVRVIDVTAFSQEAESSHFVAATSPAFLALVENTRRVNDTFRIAETRLPRLDGVDADVERGADAVRVIVAAPGEAR